MVRALKAEKLMKTHTRRIRARVRAFTLLEVLMVVVIIGLLAAFVVPNFINAPTTAKIGLTEAAVGSNGSIASALKMYRLAMGHYPTTDEGLKALTEVPDEEEQAKAWRKGGGPFIEDVNGLKDPWTHEYLYVCPGTYNTEGFDLSSAGPDGQEGTDDDIVNWKKG
jgi:general secretion pathway protein G